MNPSRIMPAPEKIVHDNQVMHDKPGYARFYDENLGIIRNAWERQIFLSRLADLNKTLQASFPNETIRSLDLGAGTGNLTIPLLQAGHHVTAVDLSAQMLKQLSANCRTRQAPEDQLAIVCEPVDTVLDRMIDAKKTFHLVTACSFYHHVPDYLGTLERASRVVAQGGFLFLAHEPMRKDTIGPFSRLMQALDFKCWRLKVHVQQMKTQKANVDEYYDPDSQADFWDLTTGCDQRRMVHVLEDLGLRTTLVCYDSRRSQFLHRISRGLRMKTLFLIVAKKAERLQIRWRE